MVYESRFFEQKEISAAEKKQNGVDSIKKSDGNEQREKTERSTMEIKAVAGPGMDPRESIIFK